MPLMAATPKLSLLLAFFADSQKFSLSLSLSLSLYQQGGKEETINVNKKVSFKGLNGNSINRNENIHWKL